MMVTTRMYGICMGQITTQITFYRQKNPSQNVAAETCCSKSQYAKTHLKKKDIYQWHIPIFLSTQMHIGICHYKPLLLYVFFLVCFWFKLIAHKHSETKYHYNTVCVQTHNVSNIASYWPIFWSSHKWSLSTLEAIHKGFKKFKDNWCRRWCFKIYDVCDCYLERIFNNFQI